MDDRATVEGLAQVRTQFSRRRLVEMRGWFVEEDKLGVRRAE
jgi:hypothetical protein